MINVFIEIYKIVSQIILCSIIYNYKATNRRSTVLPSEIELIRRKSSDNTVGVEFGWDSER